MSHPKESKDPILSGKKCPYCGGKTEYVDSSVIYGISYGMIYLCRPCGAYCGVHRGTDISKGSLANRALRTSRKEAHEFFDKLWQLKHLSRHEAYKWLQEYLKIDKELVHIGMFNEAQCKEVVYGAKQLLNDFRRLDLDFGAEPKTPFYHYDNA